MGRAELALAPTLTASRRLPPLLDWSASSSHPSCEDGRKRLCHTHGAGALGERQAPGASLDGRTPVAGHQGPVRQRSDQRRRERPHPIPHRSCPGPDR